MTPTLRNPLITTTGVVFAVVLVVLMLVNRSDGPDTWAERRRFNRRCSERGDRQRAPGPGRGRRRRAPGLRIARERAARPTARYRRHRSRRRREGGVHGGARPRSTKPRGHRRAGRTGALPPRLQDRARPRAGRSAHQPDVLRSVRRPGGRGDRARPLRRRSAHPPADGGLQALACLIRPGLLLPRAARGLCRSGGGSAAGRGRDAGGGRGSLVHPDPDRRPGVPARTAGSGRGQVSGCPGRGPRLTRRPTPALPRWRRPKGSRSRRSIACAGCWSDVPEAPST